MSEKSFTSDKPIQADGAATKKAYVVLVVVGDLLERASTATHLRTMDCHVIEAADGDDARRVLDSVHVDVMLGDFAVSGKTKGLALLRLLRQRHPAIKTIFTSDTEADLAALDGCGFFLSKPYRLADLAYCLHKASTTARIAANGAAGVMAAKSKAKTSPERGQAQPISANPNRPPARHMANGPDNEVSKSSMAELSRRLRERAAEQRAIDPAAAKAARGAALQAYDRADARRLKLVLGVAIGAVAGLGIACLVPTIGLLPASPPTTTAHTEQALPIEMAAVTQVPNPPDSAPLPMPPPTSLVSARPSATMGTEPAPATGSQPAPAEPTANGTALRRDEVREVQARLRSFGVNPGRDDGVPGPTTEGAVMHYQKNRGQPQTGTVDRQLLEQLRQDSALQVARRAARPDARATRSPQLQRSDPFGPVRVAGDRFGQWLDSLVR
jgi:DNA-binding NarL/FixJ family response regulator